MSYKFGWIPDLPDHRDMKYRAVAPVHIADHVDMRNINFMPTIVDQGDFSACTGNSTAALFHYMHRKLRVKEKDFQPSRMLIYNLTRMLEGTPLVQDCGAYLRDCIKVIATNGVCDEKIFPYDQKRFTKEPSRTVLSAAKKHKALQYFRIENLDEMLTCLSEGYPFVFGITVYESFMTPEVEKTGWVPMPSLQERVRGGHAIWACGHDTANKTILCANSWGTGWGDKGFFYLPLAYAGNPDLATDAWTVRMES